MPLTAVEAVDFDAGYAMLNKIFAPDYSEAGRYSPPRCIGVVKNPIKGNLIRRWSTRLSRNGRTLRCGWQCVALRA